MMRPEKADLYEGVPAETYHAWEAESRTGCVKAADSPAVYRLWLDEEREPTDAMIRGTGGDLLLFEGPQALAKAISTRPMRMDELPGHFIPLKADPSFVSEKTGQLLKAGKDWVAEQEARGMVVVRPGAWKASGLDLLTTAGKAWKAEVKESGRQIVSRDIWEQIHGVAEAARAHDLARYYLGLDGGVDVLHQPSLLWQDSETGLWCKARPDALRLQGGTFAQLGDLKIPEVDVRPPELGGDYHRQIFKQKLHWQAGWYCRAVREATGATCDSFNLIAIQAKPPHRVEHHYIEGEELEQGEAECVAQLRLIERCRRHNHWPKESGQSHRVTFKPWQRQ